MIIEGKYNSAKVMRSDIDQHTRAQVQLICDMEWFKDFSIVIMPDAHAGKPIPIGFTAMMKFRDFMNGPIKRLMPSIIGPDIGCGVSVYKINNEKNIQCPQLDKVIKKYIPSGKYKRGDTRKTYRIPEGSLRCQDKINIEACNSSMGTLGGGNHFIELAKDNHNVYYMIIHTGSRSLGSRVYTYYIDKANYYCKSNGINLDYIWSILPEELSMNYFKDVDFIDVFASINRDTIFNIIKDKMKWKDTEKIVDNSHNTYWSLEDEDEQEEYIIIGKGAQPSISEIAVPINNVDGTLLMSGYSNKKWNYSAPHGAGRLIPRKEVSNHHTLNEYKKIMEDAKVYSSTIDIYTLDEGPFVYRNLDQIEPYISDTAEFTTRLVPIYNFKGGWE